MCGASMTTSSIMLLWNKCIVERNSHSKPEGCFSQKGNIKIFVSHRADISDFGLQDKLLYRLWALFECKGMHIIYIRQ